MKLFVISVKDEPGALADVCNTIQPANLKYIATQKSSYGGGFIKIVTDDDEEARKNLAEKRYMFIEEPLLLVKTNNTAESIFDITNNLGSKEINIENMFALEPGVLALIISPEDTDKVKDMLKDSLVQ